MTKSAPARRSLAGRLGGHPGTGVRRGQPAGRRAGRAGRPPARRRPPRGRTTPCRPFSTSSGTSWTTTASGGACGHQLARVLAADQRMDDRVERGAAGPGRRTRGRPAPARSRVPSAGDDRRRRRPRRTAGEPGVPGSTTSRATTSASMTAGAVTPRAARATSRLAGADPAGQAHTQHADHPPTPSHGRRHWMRRGGQPHLVDAPASLQIASSWGWSALVGRTSFSRSAARASSEARVPAGALGLRRLLGRRGVRRPAGLAALGDRSVTASASAFCASTTCFWCASKRAWASAYWRSHSSRCVSKPGSHSPVSGSKPSG